MKHARDFQRIGMILGVAEQRHRAHPVEIGARAEHRPTRADHDHTRFGGSFDIRKCRGDLGNQRVIESIADFGAVEPQPAHGAALLDLDVLIVSHASRHMRKMPKRVSGMGCRSATARPSPRHMRVSTGSMTPSSQRRAVA